MSVPFNGDGNLIKFQPTHDETISSTPFKKTGVNNGEDQPILIHCLTDGNITFETWGGETVTRTFVAGQTFEVLAREVDSIGAGTFSALY